MKSVSKKANNSGVVSDTVFAAALQVLEEKMCYQFRDRNLLKTAMTHVGSWQGDSSFLERKELESLGDNLLELRVKAYAENAKNRGWVFEDPVSFLNSNVHLARVGYHALSLYRALRADAIYAWLAGPETQIRRMADTVEALIGALYHDGGDGAVDKFIDTFVLPQRTYSRYMDTMLLLHDQQQSVLQDVIEEACSLFLVPVHMDVALDKVRVSCGTKHTVAVPLNQETRRTSVLRGVVALAATHPWTWYGFSEPTLVPLLLASHPNEKRIESDLKHYYPVAQIVEEETFVPYTEVKGFVVEETWQQVALPALLPLSTCDKGPYIDKLRLLPELAGKVLEVRSESTKKGTQFALFVDGKRTHVSEPCRTLNEAANQMIRAVRGNT